MSEHLMVARRIYNNMIREDRKVDERLEQFLQLTSRLLFHLESHPSPVPQTPESEGTRSSSPATAPTVDAPSGSSTSSATYSLVRTDHRGSQVLALTSLGPNSLETVGDVLRYLQALPWTQPAHETQGSPWQFGQAPSISLAGDQDGPPAGGAEAWAKVWLHHKFVGSGVLCEECSNPRADTYHQSPSSPSPAIHAQGDWKADLPPHKFIETVLGGPAPATYPMRCQTCGKHLSDPVHAQGEDA